MDLTGTVFDERYELLSQLGSGGMGAVYRAHDRKFDRDVAIKLLLPEATALEEFQKRFKREAQALANLRCNNVVQFLGWGLWDGNPYLVMELLDGGSLAQLLYKQVSLAWQESFEIALEVCAGLTAVHELGIVHRDLSPANIFICSKPKSQIKIIDLGLASWRNNERSELTSTGMLMGSLHYMSPEVCSGQQASVESDIYGLGCILYEMISGVKALSCKNPMGLIYKHTNEYPAPLRELDPSIPDIVQAIVFKAMSKGRAERYNSAVEMASDLRNALAGNDERIAARPWNGPKPKSWTNRAKTATTGLMILLGLGTITTGIVLRSNNSTTIQTARKAQPVEHVSRFRPDSENMSQHVQMAIDAGNPPPKELEKQIDQWVHFKPERLANHNLLYVTHVYNLLGEYYTLRSDGKSVSRIKRLCTTLVNRYQPTTEAEQQAKLMHQMRLNLDLAGLANTPQEGDRYLQQYWKLLERLPLSAREDEDLEYALCKDTAVACYLQQWSRACKSAKACLEREPERYETIELAHLITLLPPTENAKKIQILSALGQYAPTAEQPKKWVEHRREEENEQRAGAQVLPVRLSRMMNIVEFCTLEGHTKTALDWLRTYQTYFKASYTNMEKLVKFYSTPGTNNCDAVRAIIQETNVGASNTFELGLKLEALRLCALYPGWRARNAKASITDADIESALAIFVALGSFKTDKTLTMSDWPRDRPADLQAAIEQFFLSDCSPISKSHRASICCNFASRPHFSIIRAPLQNIAAKLESQ